MQVRLHNQGGGNLTVTDNWRLIDACLTGPFMSFTLRTSSRRIVSHVAYACMYYMCHATRKRFTSISRLKGTPSSASKYSNNARKYIRNRSNRRFKCVNHFPRVHIHPRSSFGYFARLTFQLPEILCHRKDARRSYRYKKKFQGSKRRVSEH